MDISDVCEICEDADCMHCSLGNPCLGCEGYDGDGGCTSNGGCSAISEGVISNGKI